MRRRRGVTLIELAVVIVIIGILAAIAIPRFMRVRDSAYLSAIESDLRSFAIQQELYHDRYQQYANRVALLPEFKTTPGVMVTITIAETEGWAATATHSRIAARQCGLYYGTATAGSAPPAELPGVVNCN